MLPMPNHPGFSKELRKLKGVGPQMEKSLNKKGFKTVGDLFSFMPNRYHDRRSITPLGSLEAEVETLMLGEVESMTTKRARRTGRSFFEITISDDTGSVKIYWFRLPAFLRKSFKIGETLLIFGKVEDYHNRLFVPHPEINKWPGGADHLPPPEIRPVYPVVDGIKAGALRRVMAQLCSDLQAVPDIFPKAWLKENDLTDPVSALRVLHQPPADADGLLPLPRKSRAWKSLAISEFLFIQLALARSRARLGASVGLSFSDESALANDFLSSQLFELTESQKAVLGEIKADMARPHPMNRLLQGDVGSGKTVVALTLAMGVVDAGLQVAFMAPTEILARQHFKTFQAYAEKADIKTDLVTGSANDAEKAEMREKLASGETRVVFGTHALFSASMEFKNLGLVIIDEQHRFGVNQRLALKSKAERPDVLVMSATPIPRSLAMTLYGDLDISTIKGLPPGRQPIKTRLFGPNERKQAYKYLVQEIDQGGQAFIVAPRIEPDNEGEPGSDLSSVIELFKVVSNEILPNTAVGMAHGRMDSSELELAIKDFESGKTRVLVATTVIEVGLDIPDATMIVVEGAERFGLAQLHQLRGRVGRSDKPGKCILISNQPEPEQNQRLNILTETSDGFVLAEEDLKTRGPGDATGLRQSGLPPFTWAQLPEDLPLLIQARDLAKEIIEQDPELADASFRLVRDVVDRVDDQIRGEVSDVG